MKFVITAGGTAGHINPALALAEELVARKHEVIFAGTGNRLESKLVPQSGYDFIAFDAKGFNRKKPFSIFPSVFSIMKSTTRAKKWLRTVNPDAVIGFGCYVSIAICRAAKQLNIPYAIHEQNSVMGLANKYLSKNANVTCLTYKHADTGKCKNVQITGNPVRKSIFDAKFEDGRKLLNVPTDAKMLLVFGGSLGAAKINDAIVDMSNTLLDRKDLYIVHLTGQGQYDDVLNNLKLDDNKKSRYIVMPYQDKMGETFAATDMCISRAGASTIAEITARSLPCLLVPYPYATENHQFYNAQELLNAGCVMLMKDDELRSEKFQQFVVQLVDNEVMRKNMRDAYKKFDAKNSVKKIADLIENL